MQDYGHEIEALPLVVVLVLGGWDQSDLAVRSSGFNPSMYSATAILRWSMFFHGPLFRTSPALNSELNASARALS
jgi:hypothetical protein